jgi:site-specific DNA-methyltransferase (adenine-specific)
LELDEESWFWAAVNTDDPIGWLEYAAEAKAKDPRYSIREFKRDIVLDRNRKELKRLAARVSEDIGVEIRIGNVLDELPLIEDGRVSLCIADPPYNVKDVEWDRIGNREDYLSWIDSWLVILKTKFAERFHFFLFCDPEYQADIEMLLRRYWEIKSRLVWHHKNMTEGRSVSDRFITSWERIFHVGNSPLYFPLNWGEERFDVMEFAVPQTNFKDKKYHQAQKPLELIKRLVELATLPGEVVLDLFAGSGTTSVAAVTSGRRAIAIEKDGQWEATIRGRCAAGL